MSIPRLTSDQLAAGLAFAAFATLACLAPAQGDTWWLLRAGQDLWTTGQVPAVETYSHTAAGRPWANHEWLTELVFYALHRAGGMPLLAAACAAAATAAWGLSYSMTRGPFEVRFVVLLGCIVPAAMSFALRPQMFTMLFFVTTCVLLVRNRLRWIPLVVLVWANFHGAVALGLVATAAVCAATGLIERRLPWPLIWTTLASALATLLTPLGTELWSFWVDSALRSDLHELVEWRPPGMQPTLWPFWAISAVLVVATIRNWRHLDRYAVTTAAVAFGILPLAVQATRNVPFFLLAALPALTSVLAARPAAAVRRQVDDARPLNTLLLGPAALAAAIVVISLWTKPPSMLGWRPFSDEVVGAISRCDGPLFNTYADGGALMWFVPSVPVFIDSRQVLDPYPMELVATSREAEFNGRFESLFEQYDIRCAFLAAHSPIAAALEQDARWARRYADADWRVFERLPR